MSGRKLVHATSREEWRAWLKRHHASEKEVWLVYAKAHTGRPRVAYGDSVEEALCFGWIDSIAKRLDDDNYIQKFTPRTNTRNWSNANLERFKRMEAEGRMTDAGRVKRASDVTAPPRRFQSGDPVPSSIRKALAADPAARRRFLALAPGYRRDLVRYVTEAKKPETRERRMKEAIRRLKAGKKRLL